MRSLIGNAAYWTGVLLLSLPIILFSCSRHANNAPPDFTATVLSVHEFRALIVKTEEDGRTWVGITSEYRHAMLKPGDSVNCWIEEDYLYCQGE